MTNDALKLLEGGIVLVLSGVETYRVERWNGNDNLAQSDVKIKELLEDNNIREDAKEAFIQQLELGWEDLFMGRMATGWKSATESLKSRKTKLMSLVIEWGRTCWTTRNVMIYGEGRQRYIMERRRLQAEARVYLNAAKEEALVPIENIRSTRKNIRNMPNVEIANWIAEQQK